MYFVGKHRIYLYSSEVRLYSSFLKLVQINFIFSDNICVSSMSKYMYMKQYICTMHTAVDIQVWEIFDTKLDIQYNMIIYGLNVQTEDNTLINWSSHISISYSIYTNCYFIDMLSMYTVNDIPLCCYVSGFYSLYWVILLIWVILPIT